MATTPVLSGPFLKTPSGKTKSGYFMSINRGKESIALDLKADGDRAIFEQLLARADVVLENYRGGTMEKLGYGYETLKERFPKLIYAAVSGFGHTGPYATRPAYDMVVQAMGGIMSLTGHPGSPPTRVGTSIGDLTAALYAALGIVTALYDRKTTRQRHEGRHLHARLPGGVPRKRHRALRGDGKRPRPARRAPSLHRAVRRFCNERRSYRDRSGDGRFVQARRRCDRPAGTRERRALSLQS